ncbi:MAG: M24 family metallopeptidase [Mesorhizobium sp.]|uniref:M24 family metallopeptidase n=1 Tax=Mesorhizobium sp. TaxID=1871066 RepID=UPI000FE796CE|nr:M24 family metallopeptidase [Mesorhizobium sp.]RWH34248.1 MAG: M24 family metallopeptidase [Mesorhizobium sp.]TIR61872.1 MAG: M24 family metallopeptidase [Mesorhizobium sp.]
MTTTLRSAGPISLANRPIACCASMEAQLAGLEAGLDLIRAGAVSGEVAKVIHNTTEKHGFKNRSRAGYSIGINWMEKTTSLKLGDSTVLARTHQSGKARIRRPGDTFSRCAALRHEWAMQAPKSSRKHATARSYLAP